MKVDLIVYFEVIYLTIKKVGFKIRNLQHTEYNLNLSLIFKK